MNPRHFDLHPLTKANGRVKQVLIRRGRPQIELVSLRAAHETTVVVLHEIGRKRTTSPLATMTNWTIAIHLVASTGRWDESQQFEHLLHRHDGSHSLKIDARHRIGPE